MMKALAGYIVTGRWQAILVTTVCGVLAFMLPPVSSLLNYLAAASVALVTLHIGKAQVLQVLAISSLLTLLFYQLAGVQGGDAGDVVAALLAHVSRAAANRQPRACAEGGCVVRCLPAAVAVHLFW